MQNALVTSIGMCATLLLLDISTQLKVLQTVNPSKLLKASPLIKVGRWLFGSRE